jgi:predicted RNA-binding protein YlxR (DUF448 family)
MLPADFQELKEYHDTRKSGKAQTFIVKPEANCQGRGIFLTRNIDSNYKSMQSSKGRGAWCKDICISPF